uniref:Uncharacterized protein n=1 Tax=Anguilla anguilla TaxID=7936 RepID=A0A0E9T174_ANGAN
MQIPNCYFLKKHFARWRKDHRRCYVPVPFAFIYYLFLLKV